MPVLSVSSAPAYGGGGYGYGAASIPITSSSYSDTLSVISASIEPYPVISLSSTALPTPPAYPVETPSSSSTSSKVSAPAYIIPSAPSYTAESSTASTSSVASAPSYAKPSVPIYSLESPPVYTVSTASSTHSSSTVSTNSLPGYSHPSIPAYSQGTAPAPSLPAYSLGTAPLSSTESIPSAPGYSIGTAPSAPGYPHGTPPVYPHGTASPPPAYPPGHTAPDYSYTVTITPSGAVTPCPLGNSTGVYPSPPASVPEYGSPSAPGYESPSIPGYSVPVETDSYTSTKVIIQTISVIPTPVTEYSMSGYTIVKTATHVPPKPGSSVHYTPTPVPSGGSPPPPSNEDRTCHGYPPLPSPSPSGGSNAGAYSGPAHLPQGCQELTPALPQDVTNGASSYGMSDCEPLPFRALEPCTGDCAQSGSESNLGAGNGNGNGNGSPSSSNGQGSDNGDNGTGSGLGSHNSTCSNTCPDTGVTRVFDWTVSYMNIAPDGVMRKAVVINNQFPGPLLEANCGDYIEVRITNELDDEGTAIHWHGLKQHGTPFEDGVPSVSQCPIIPGNTKVSLFKADRVGTSWYHSHYSAQYSGGAYGPMIIHGCDDATEIGYDIDVGPVMVSDWYHDTYYQLVNATMNAPKPLGRAPSSDNILIQGKNNFPCADAIAGESCTPNAGLAKFHFESGKKHLLRLINPSSDAMIKFSIDGHQLKVISNDFVPIEPYTTNVVTLAVGQRTEIIVEGLHNVSSVWMRADTGPAGPASCSNNKGISTSALAAVYYDDTSDVVIPTSKSSVTLAQLLTCKNDALVKTEPTEALTPPTSDVFTQRIDINFVNNGTNFVWDMNNSTFRGDYSVSLLQQVQQGNLTFADEWNVYNMGNYKSVRLVVYNHFPFTSHPMHLHGHDFWVLEEGFGTWNGTIVNPQNPARRDVHVVQRSPDFDTPAYAVYQYDLDNPGVWPFHCHVAWHVSAGLYINLMERPEEIRAISVPSDVSETCMSWAQWTSDHAVDQIDSGL